MKDDKKKMEYFDLEKLSFDRDSGHWTATFAAKTEDCVKFDVKVSISDSTSGDIFDGYPQNFPAELAAHRLRQKAHHVLQQLLEVSGQNLRKSDELLPKGVNG